jgi:hypothetical protein
MSTHAPKGPKTAPGDGVGQMDRRDFARLSLQGAFLLAIAGPWVGRAAAAAAQPGTQPWRAESTRRMEALLRKITREADPMLNPYRCREQVALLRPLVAREGDIHKLFTLRTQLALQLLLSGDPDAAIQELDGIDRMVAERDIPLDDKGRKELMMSRAICFLRKGEQENCCANHNADSCLFPIHGKGFHTKPAGSRGAISILEQVLENHQDDLRARWLLNIAYMTLNEYPSKVPPRWLLDPKLFASDFDIGRFRDVAADVGLNIDGLAGGVVLEDFDNDGFLDVMVSSWGLEKQMRFFHNNGDGTFTERTREAGLIGELGGINMISCDYNNDGLVDVLILRGAWIYKEGHYPMSLLRNNGDGTFTDVTEEAGLLRLSPSPSAVWFDYNNDGWLDLFVAAEAVGDDRVPCQLYRNNGDGTFTECAAQCGVDVVAFVKGVASADYNNDGRPDLVVSRMDGPPLLFRNDGPAGEDTSPKAAWRFTEVAAASGITRPKQSFPCWFFDYNNDGWPDLFVSGYAYQNVGDVAADYLHLPHAGQIARLYRNNGDGTFTDVSKECGVNKLYKTMGCNFGDLDNDGWLDFYLGTGDPDFASLVPNRMLRNDGGQRFQDVTTSGGFGQLQKGHAIAFGDINNDGTQDIYAVVGGAYEGDDFHQQLFANPGHGNNWLKLKLEGVRTNRAAIGAKIKVVVESEGGQREIHRVVGSGGSFGANPLRQEIGLGKAMVIRRVEIFWPVTAKTQVVSQLEINRFYHVREGAEAAQPIELRSFKWPVPA